MLNQKIIVQLLILGKMKTIDKKNKNQQATSKKEAKRFFVDHPEGHELLSTHSSPVNRDFIAGVIDIKSSRERKNKSAKFLVSSISLCLSLLFVIWAFEFQFAEEKVKVELDNNSNPFEDLMEIPQTEQIQKPPVQVQAPTIVEVDDEEIIEVIEVNLDIEMTEDTRIEEVVMAEESEPMPEETADEIFTIVEQQPEPSGGLKAFYDYVGANLKYPARAARMGIEGRVFVEFVVEKDGSLTDIKVVKGIGAGCDEEAIRVLSNAPNWKPGKQRGNPVRVRMVMPIMFVLLSK
jgi:protein TonB